MKKRINVLDRFLAANFAFGTKSFSVKQLILFSTKLQAQIQAHYPLPDALEIIYETTSERTMRMMLRGITANVQAGNSLSQSMLTFKELFPNYFVATVMACERSGRLAQGLEAIIKYLKNERLITDYSQIIYFYVRMIVYVLVIAVSVGLFSSGLLLFSVDNLLLTMAVIFFLGLVASTLIHTLSDEKHRLTAERILFRLPLFGDLYKMITTSRLAYLFNTFQKSAVPFLQNVDIISHYIGNSHFQDEYNIVLEGLKEQGDVRAVLRKIKHLPKAFINELFLFQSGATKVDSLDNYSMYLTDEIETIYGKLLSTCKSVFVYALVFFLVVLYLLFVI